MKKHLKYLSYVIRHKWFVFVASRRVGGVSLFRALIHDWTKFLPSEWFPYAEFFYGNGSRDKFNVAWLFHQKRNKHHWQYWMLQNDSGEYFPLPIPRKYEREMVADWMGAGRAIHGRWECADWYVKNRDKILLHPETRARVELLLDVINSHP